MARIKRRDLDAAMIETLAELVDRWLDQHCTYDCDFVLVVDPDRPTDHPEVKSAVCIGNISVEDSAVLAAEAAHHLTEKMRIARGDIIATSPRVFDA